VTYSSVETVEPKLSNSQSRGARRYPIDELRRLLNYDPITGALTWRVSNRRRRAGDAAGYIGYRGYLYINLGNKQFRGHRLAWAIVTGTWPSEIDHANGDTADNRWSNLREATRSQNCANRRGWGKYLKGVRRQDGRWYARIRIDGRMVYLGGYDTEDEAHVAYCAEAERIHGQFMRAA
jgi:hypothetical protein